MPNRVPSGNSRGRFGVHHIGSGLMLCEAGGMGAPCRILVLDVFHVVILINILEGENEQISIFEKIGQ